MGKRIETEGAQLLLFPTRRLPIFRSECADGAEARMIGEATCDRYTCRHNLIGEMANMDMKRALRVAQARLEGKITASCSLDVADMGPASDREIARMLGMGQRAFEAYAEEQDQKLWDTVKI